MMGGMGEELEYKVTLLPEKSSQNGSANVVEEEEEACGEDVDDVFAMMGGMGEEQEYKVTLVQENAEDDTEAAADDEEGEPYPEITYGAEVPEKISSEKMEKKMKKVVKEGGKRGVEI